VKSLGYYLHFKGKLNCVRDNTVYGKRSFLSKESDTLKILQTAEYIFRLRCRHHQLLFK